MCRVSSDLGFTTRINLGSGSSKITQQDFGLRAQVVHNPKPQALNPEP